VRKGDNNKGRKERAESGEGMSWVYRYPHMPYELQDDQSPYIINQLRKHQNLLNDV
jgi:hypothetical protein